MKGSPALWTGFLEKLQSPIFKEKLQTLYHFSALKESSNPPSSPLSILPGAGLLPLANLS